MLQAGKLQLTSHTSDVEAVKQSVSRALGKLLKSSLVKRDSVHFLISKLTSTYAIKKQSSLAKLVRNKEYYLKIITVTKLIERTMTKSTKQNFIKLHESTISYFDVDLTSICRRQIVGCLLRLSQMADKRQIVARRLGEGQLSLVKMSLDKLRLHRTVV